MTASFAVYASQFLNRQQRPTSSGSSSSQRLFYSFTTDNGSHAENMSHSHRSIELDDEDDPHFSHGSNYTAQREREPPDENDPYLRLDEDELPLSHMTRSDAGSMPLIASESRLGAGLMQGWLAHQGPTSYHISAPRRSDSSSESDTQLPPTYPVSSPTFSSRPAQGESNPLTESLLPRDGISRPIDVFSLPDPRMRQQGRVVIKDKFWTVVWQGSMAACMFGAFIILFTTSTSNGKTHGAVLPYTTLLHTIPLVTILILSSAIVCYSHLLLLKVFVKPVVFFTSVFIPLTLFISAIWAFIGSFMWEEGNDPTWGGTIGLRLFAVIPLVLAIITSRRLVNLPEDLHTTSSVLNLATSLLIANPFLLALSPLILLIALLGSIPFLTLAFRLLLIGYVSMNTGSKWEWHVRNWAGWAIAGTILVWLWSWGVARGVLRTTCAAVIGAWYFNPVDYPEPSPLDTHRIHSALFRSTHASLGTVVLSALLLTGVRILTLLAILLRKTPVPLLRWITVPLGLLENATSALSTLALIYTGLTGDSFFPSARRARALTSAINNSNGKVRYRRTGFDPSLGILTITPLTLTLPFALSTYLFVVHTLGAPGYAPIAALLAGGTTALVGLFCVGLVEDTADTLYMCYCIDRDVGQMHQKDVFHAFEWQRPSHDVRSTRMVQPERVDPSTRARSPLSESSEEIAPAKESSHPLQSTTRLPDTGPSMSQGPLSDSRESAESMILGDFF